MSEPTVYVACLTSYNCGVSSGAWRTADQLEEGLRHPHPSPAREEWAIHATNGIPRSSAKTPTFRTSSKSCAASKNGVMRSWRGSNLTLYNLQHHDDLGEAFQEAFCGETLATGLRGRIVEEIAEERGWLPDDSPHGAALIGRRFGFRPCKA